MCRMHIRRKEARLCGVRCSASFPGKLLAGRVAEGQRYKDENGRLRIKEFDYVRLEQNSNLSITITVGYADENQPRGSRVIGLNDGIRTCTGGAIEGIWETPGGGEGFSAINHYHYVLHKDPSGDIVARQTSRQSRTVAHIPVGTITEAYTLSLQALRWTTKEVACQTCLREQVRHGNPVFDSYRDPVRGKQIHT